MVIIGDFARDLDDEHTLLLAASLQRLGWIRLVAVVANLKPAEIRARVAKGTLQQLGLGQIPVGVGMPVFADSETHAYETEVPYMAQPDEVVPGYALLVETLAAAPAHSLTLVLQSGLTDAAHLLRRQQALFLEKVAAVAIMGGVSSDDDGLVTAGSLIQPDDAANLAYDPGSGAWLYRELQRHRVPLCILTRHAAYATRVPITMYAAMKASGPIGTSLAMRQEPAIQALWQAACAPPGAAVRGSLPPSRDRRWFVATYCDGVDPAIGSDDDICPHAKYVNLFDPLNLIAAIPQLRDRFFAPTGVRVDGVTHRIIGLSHRDHGVRDPDGLRSFLVDCELAALSIP